MITLSGRTTPLIVNLEKPAREVLRFLFTEYLKAPAATHSINGVAKKCKIDPDELGAYLISHDWVMDLYSGSTVACRITIKGIEEIDPIFVREKLKQVIGGLGEAGGSKELIEVLSYRIEEYSITMDIIRQLENLGFIEVGHRRDSIVIKLTEKGRGSYQKGSRSFFTLMTY
jgi:hypothetical protein